MGSIVKIDIHGRVSTGFSFYIRTGNRKYDRNQYKYKNVYIAKPHLIYSLKNIRLKLPEIFPEVKEVKSFKRFDLSKEEITKITGQKVSDSMQKTFTIFRRDGQVLTESQIAVFSEGKMKVYEVGAEIATVLKDNNAAKRIRVLDRVDSIFFIFPLYIS